MTSFLDTLTRRLDQLQSQHRTLTNRSCINKVINELNPLNGKCEYIKALIFIKMQDPIGACPLLKTSIRSGFTASENLYNQYCNF